MEFSFKRHANKSALSRVYGKDRVADFSKPKAVLDGYHELAQSGLVISALHATNQYVEQYRRSMTTHWPAFVSDVCRPHPLFHIFQQDPMTRRIYEKPRGYAGDAVMLDYIYDKNLDSCTEEVTPEGREIFNTLVKMPSGGSVNYRRQVLAQAIDEKAEAHAKENAAPIRVLNLACGHARELEFCKTLRTGKVQNILACDQDEQSLETLKTRYPDAPVETKRLRVKDLLVNPDTASSIGKFDLIYSMGLYDYLEERVAARLTRVLFECLSPNGRLLLANYHVDHYGTGFMEAFQDWNLIHRTDKQMRALTQEIDKSQIAQIKQFKDPFGNVAYLQIERKA